MPISPLHVAAFNADLDEVCRLLSEGVLPNVPDENGFTALHLACMRAVVGDQLPVVKTLLQAGADPNASNGGSNCLMRAADSGNEPVVCALIDAGARMDEQVNEVTALMYVAQSGGIRMVELLLELGADPAIQAGRFTAADYAHYGGHDDLARLLTIAMMSPAFGKQGNGS